MAQANAVDQNANIEPINEFLQRGIVAVLVLCKIHCERLGADLGTIFGRDVGSERGKLRLGARNENEVVAFLGQGQSEFLADAVRGTGYEGPRAARAEFGQLIYVRNCMAEAIFE